MLEIICVVSFVAVALILSSVKFLKEYERLVIFRLGRLNGVRGPGPQIVWPFIETYRKIDVRETTLIIQVGNLTTLDMGSINANGTCSLQIADAGKCITLVDDFREATRVAAANAIKEVLSKYRADDINLSDARLKRAVRNAIDKNTTKWGIRVTDFFFEVEKTSNGSVLSIADDHDQEPSVKVHVLPSENKPEQKAEFAADKSPLVETNQHYPQPTVFAQSQTPAHPQAAHHYDHPHHSILHSHSHEHNGHHPYQFGAHLYEYGHDKAKEEKAEVADQSDVADA